MSVINRMLQELEARHEDAGALPGPVRAVPPPATPAWRWLVLGLALVVLAGVSWLVWREETRPVPAQRAGGTRPPAVDAAPPPVAQVEPSLQLRLAEPPPPQPPAPPAPASGPATPLPPASARAPAPATPVAGAPAPSLPPAPTEVNILKQISPAQRADQHYREALALLAGGRTAEAENLLEEALRLDPRHLAARQALLAQRVNAGRHEEAQRLLQAGLAEPALAQGEAAAVLAMALARLQLERSGAASALATLERYAPQAAGNAEYAAFQAALLQRLERHGEAVTHFQSALRLRPQQAAWWLGLALSLEASGRAAEAGQAFERARQLPGLTPELRALVDQRLAHLRAQP